ncbi:hypothetical protein B0A49_07236 [Cryomyces minteri]|uniref:C2H2-type domain-containing protein n=1 Tax=Cryomyces minteri TaxID=331657 RepID=A0A4U0WUQ6_9PEZI|nr:hypothetical protein B0A49_07236 [Cryomyces minteri]
MESLRPFDDLPQIELDQHGPLYPEYTWSSLGGDLDTPYFYDDAFTMKRLDIVDTELAGLSQNYHGSVIVQDSYYSGGPHSMYSNGTHSGGDSFIALRQIQQYPDEEPDDSEGYPCSDIKIESAACEQESIYLSEQMGVDVSHNRHDVVDEGLGESIRDPESVQPRSKEEEDSDYRPTSSSPALRRRKRPTSQSSTGFPARKRHVSSQHMRLGFWRCDQCPESDSRPNDFNRKDLFIQHLRRMHSASMATAFASTDSITPSRPSRRPAAPSLSTKRSASSSSPPPSDATPDALLAAASARCYHRLRAPPPQSSCLFCGSTFSGAGSWDLRMEHVGRHLEADRKAGTAGVAGAEWRVDDVLAAWLEAEGLVVREGSGWRLGRG